MRGEIRQQGDGFLSFFDDEQDKNKLFLEQKIVSNRRPLAAFFAWFYIRQFVRCCYRLIYSFEV